MRIGNDVMALVGHTPMVRINRLTAAGSAEVWAKLEMMNPGGSIKDRAALGMVLDAERRGVLKPGGTICEATAGNTGIGLALIGVQRGYRVKLFVPEGFAEEKCIIMRGLGAEVERTPESEMVAGAIRRALAFERETPGAFAAMQFENPANPDFHEETTAVEIFEQMEGRIDAVVFGVGSAGTFTGIARFMKKKLAAVLTVAVETQGSVLQGGEPGHHRVEGIGVSFVPPTFDRSVCDRIVKVTDDDAFAMVRRMAREEGILGGSSSGAMMAAAVEVARELGAGKRVVTLVPDSAERYLSKGILDE
ncbi:PLP-dependent cysteine synthase family protein [Granulicella mallensis]|uniref:Cysteine synthase n=1 Tax=Granulicella mallensis (strain ATCC BAA-1857 / DSM 23137 / MP5ACTX8) TaxID=682795 RepID=G8P034_GRAMM|nr:cysteine synthase family protein [Granulicella mallensis]AEU35750.1 Cysteine synthase [Granulicella mallensis MP5ACTX8]